MSAMHNTCPRPNSSQQLEHPTRLFRQKTLFGSAVFKLRSGEHSLSTPAVPFYY
jgi:hypothetical protein